VTRPLEGIQVLELSHYIAGPYAAMILGDQGASVCKVEPLNGEPGRRAMPWADDGESIYYACYNRNKTQLAMDLGKTDNLARLQELIAASDVLITNYSIGVPEKLGFGWEQVRAANPRCSMVHISGFGSKGPLSRYVAFDGVVQAISGLADMTGHPECPPVINNVLVADHSTAVQAAFAAVLAIQKRDRTGTGSFVEVSMLRSLVALFGDLVPQVTGQHRDPHRNGNRSRLRFGNTYRTSDGWLLIAPIAPTMWCDLCRIIGHDEWARPEIAEQRIHIHDEQLRADAEAAINEWLTGRTTAAAEELLQAKGIACGGVRSIRQLLEANQEQDLGLLTKVAMTSGSEVRVVGPAFSWGDGVRPAVIGAVGADNPEPAGGRAGSSGNAEKER